jgi:hypothetical protein
VSYESKSKQTMLTSRGNQAKEEKRAEGRVGRW